MAESGDRIGAVVLAAGQSRRMGRPKMVLPWGTSSVIGQVATVLDRAGISPIVVVTGGAESQVISALEGLPVSTIHNPFYLQSEMLLSLQLGLRAMPEDVPAILVCLGDQPQIEAEVVIQVATRYRETKMPLVIPSYQMRRGHPWLVDRNLWAALLAFDPGSNLRQFLQLHQDMIAYVTVSTGSILKDLDTPGDYAADAPGDHGVKR
jgi:molybdenum cofactor cytidylyltransferase